MEKKVSQIGVLVVAGLMAISVSAKAKPMSCKLMESMATNTAQQAYEETRNHIELVSESGLFDTWMMITTQLIHSYKQPDNAEFIGTAKIAGKSMIEQKSEIVKGTAPEQYAILFGRMTFRTCDYAEQKGWRK